MYVNFYPFVIYPICSHYLYKEIIDLDEIQRQRRLILFNQFYSLTKSDFKVDEEAIKEFLRASENVIILIQYSKIILRLF